MTERIQGMGFRHFFGVRASHIEFDQWMVTEDTLDYNDGKLRGGGFKVRALTTFTDFAGGENFIPGTAIVFSFASCPVVENGHRFPYSRQTGNTIAKGRFESGKTLSVVSEASSIDDASELTSQLMLDELGRVHRRFGEYQWFKGPIKVRLGVEVAGFAVADRLLPVREAQIIDEFTIGDGVSTNGLRESREHLRAAREGRGLVYTAPPSEQHANA